MTKQDKQNGLLLTYAIITTIITFLIYLFIFSLVSDGLVVKTGITDKQLSITVLVTVFLGASLCNIFIWGVHKIYEYPRTLPLLGRHWEKTIQGLVGYMQILFITFIFAIKTDDPKISQTTFFIIVIIGASIALSILLSDVIYLYKNFRGLKYIGDEEQQDLQSTETHNLHFAVSALKDSEITKLKNELSEKQKELVRTQQQLDEYKNMGAFRLLLHKLF